MLREYRLEVFYGKDKISSDRYKRLWECCFKIMEILGSMGLLEIASKGSLIETTVPFSENKYYKTYTIENEVPNLKINLKKLSSGDLEIERVKMYLDKIKEIYDRNHY